MIHVTYKQDVFAIFRKKFYNFCTSALSVSASERGFAREYANTGKLRTLSSTQNSSYF